MQKHVSLSGEALSCRLKLPGGWLSTELEKAGKRLKNKKRTSGGLESDDGWL